MHERIAAIISALGLRKVEFARRLNLSQPFVSELCAGKNNPSDRTITDICREFDVNEHWLRTGEGKMFIEKTRENEIAAFMGDVLRSEPDFRHRLISALAKMSVDEWATLEKIAQRLSEEE